MFCTLIFRSGARFSKGPDTFLARRQIHKTCSTVHSLQPVKFASFTESFIVSLSKFVKTVYLECKYSEHEIGFCRSRLLPVSGPEKLSARDFRQTGPRPQASKNVIIITYIRTPTTRFLFLFVCFFFFTWRTFYLIHSKLKWQEKH